MKAKNKSLVMLTSILLLLIVFSAGTIVAQTQGQENLLTNPGFEDGHYSQGGIAEITVPTGWRLHWLDDVTFPGAFNDLVAYRPESVVWNISGAPSHEVDLFWRDGIYTLKVFKSWAPMYSALSQDVSGLEVGRRYRLVAPIYVDIFEDFQGGKKVTPARRDSGQVRLGASPVGAPWRDATQIAYSGWWTGESITPFYQDYNIFVYDFTATQESMTVWIEFLSNYPHPNNGFFIDTVGLYTLDEVGPPPATRNPNLPTATPYPTPTPRPDGAIVHIVQSGDTFWTIAVQYAPALGIPPEEALPLIREINNDPQFINVGQELLIAPGGEPIPEETPVTEPETESEETTTEAVTEEVSTRDEDVAAGGVDLTGDSSETVVAVASTGGGSGEPELGAELSTGSVCVSAFNDINSDGVRDASNETLLADAALTLSRAGGNPIATYISDGLNEVHCFENLEPDTYQIEFFPPADYRPTTQSNGWVSVANGTSGPIPFGAQYDPVAVAAVNTQPSEPLSDDVAEAPTESEGLGIGVGTIVIGIAVLLVLLAGFGVVLLRRG